PRRGPGRARDRPDVPRAPRRGLGVLCDPRDGALRDAGGGARNGDRLPRPRRAGLPMARRVRRRRDEVSTTRRLARPDGRITRPWLRIATAPRPLPGVRGARRGRGELPRRPPRRARDAGAPSRVRVLGWPVPPAPRSRRGAWRARRDGVA